MRHRKLTFKIGRKSAHVRSLLANSVCSLIQHGRITTTIVKAKRVRILADQMVTLGKEGTLHARKQAIAKLRQPATVRILFDEIAPGFRNRTGGYTRIYKLGPRIGDGAEMAIIEFVENDEIVAARQKTVDEAKTADAKIDGDTVEVAEEEAVETAEAEEEAAETAEAEEEEAAETAEAEEEAVETAEAEEEAAETAEAEEEAVETAEAREEEAETAAESSTEAEA